jgi:carbon-monoxide dehydrogenase small subunit
MQIKQSFVVPHPRAEVWALLGRVEDVVPCMPGARLTEPAQGHRLKAEIRVKLGPIAASFQGDADHERDDDAFRGVIRGSGRDARGDSRAKGQVGYRLFGENAGAGTRVDIDVDFALTGTLAQFSRADIVNDLAKRLTAEFAKNLAARLGEAATKPAAAPSPTAPASAAPLDAGRLLLSVLWSRFLRFLRRLAS